MVFLGEGLGHQFIYTHRIGIGGSHHRLHPCHTTRHAGPHRAVEMVEVMLEVALPHARFRWFGFGEIGSLAATPLRASPAPTLWRASLA